MRMISWQGSSRGEGVTVLSPFQNRTCKKWRLILPARRNTIACGHSRRSYTNLSSDMVCNGEQNKPLKRLVVDSARIATAPKRGTNGTCLSLTGIRSALKHGARPEIVCREERSRL